MFSRHKPNPALQASPWEGFYSSFGGRIANDDTMMQFRKDWVFFFDIDGTLADIAPRPDDAHIPYATLNDLLFLQKKTAVALVSGRSLLSIDTLTAPIEFPAAGQHGLEIRFSDNEIVHVTDHKHVMDAINEEVKVFAAKHPRLLVEYKGLGVALHYRLAPELEGEVKNFVNSLLKQKESLLCIQHGKMVEEIRLRGANKGTAIAKFMQNPGFVGKIPVFAGDDQTDEDAHRMVNKLGGVSIQIGAPSDHAQFNFGSPQNLRAWINQIVTNWEIEQ